MMKSQQMSQAVTASVQDSASRTAPSNEVSIKRTRRKFNAEYKRRILRESDACSKQGEISALLRREGLYSSMLASWRVARERGEIAGLSKKRGRKPHVIDERDRLITLQQREIAKLTLRAEQAEAVIEIQKKISQLLGIPLTPIDEDNS